MVDVKSGDRVKISFEADVKNHFDRLEFRIDSAYALYLTKDFVHSPNVNREIIPKPIPDGVYTHKTDPGALYVRQDGRWSYFTGRLVRDVDGDFDVDQLTPYGVPA